MNKYQENFERIKINKGYHYTFILPEKGSDKLIDDSLGKVDFIHNKVYKGVRRLFFLDEEVMYEYQSYIGMDKYLPRSFYCKLCEFKCDHQRRFDDHLQTNKCRKAHGLEPLLDVVHNKKGHYYHCTICDYKPKNPTIKGSMVLHSRSKKHINQCVKNNIDVNRCVIPKGNIIIV